MWHEGRIFFASDRDGTMNIWSMTAEGTDLKQLTNHKYFDIQDPRIDDGNIIYQFGADIHIYNISSGSDEKLMRKVWMYWAPRTGQPSWNMQYAFRGHMIILVNERTASDGEAVAYGFRELGLGKVLGTRTWGGEIWLSSGVTMLVDRGNATAAMTGVYDKEGNWLIEGHGVDPDIVVDNLPHSTFNGSDAQLEAAIKYLEELIEKDPRPLPQPPPYPDKSFNYEQQ